MRTAMRLDELHIALATVHEQQAVDGRRDADRYKTARLARNVRKNQILAT